MIQFDGMEITREKLGYNIQLEDSKHSLTIKMRKPRGQPAMATYDLVKSFDGQSAGGQDVMIKLRVTGDHADVPLPKQVTDEIAVKIANQHLKRVVTEARLLRRWLSVLARQ